MSKKYTLNETIARHNLKQINSIALRGQLLYNRNKIEQTIEDIKHRLDNLNNGVRGVCIPDFWTVQMTIEYLNKRLNKCYDELKEINRQDYNLNKKEKLYKEVLYKNKTVSDILGRFMFENNNNNTRKKIANELTEFVDYNRHNFGNIENFDFNIGKTGIELNFSIRK